MALLLAGLVDREELGCGSIVRPSKSSVIGLRLCFGGDDILFRQLGIDVRGEKRSGVCGLIEVKVFYLREAGTSLQVEINRTLMNCNITNRGRYYQVLITSTGPDLPKEAMGISGGRPLSQLGSSREHKEIESAQTRPRWMNMVGGGDSTENRRW
jgi:hypothetical protein